MTRKQHLLFIGFMVDGLLFYPGLFVFWFKAVINLQTEESRDKLNRYVTHYVLLCLYPYSVCVYYNPVLQWLKYGYDTVRMC